MGVVRARRNRHPPFTRRASAPVRVAVWHDAGHTSTSVSPAPAARSSGPHWPTMPTRCAGRPSVPARSTDEMFHAAVEMRRDHASWGLRRRDVEGAWAGVCRRALKDRGPVVVGHAARRLLDRADRAPPRRPGRPRGAPGRHRQGPRHPSRRLLDRHARIRQRDTLRRLPPTPHGPGSRAGGPPGGTGTGRGPGSLDGRARRPRAGARRSATRR